MAVFAVPVLVSMVIGPAVIDMTRAIVMNVIDVGRVVNPRIVDRRRLVVRGRCSIVGRYRRVHRRRRGVVPGVVIGRRTRGEACSRNRADRAAQDGTMTALNVMANRGAAARADAGAP